MLSNLSVFCVPLPLNLKTPFAFREPVNTYLHFLKCIWSDIFKTKVLSEAKNLKCLYLLLRTSKL